MRKLEKGVGYYPIFLSDRMKIELTTNGNVLRRTSIKNGISQEYLYERVLDSARIRAIEEKSVNWKLMEVEYSKKYFVLCQGNAENKHTGNIKIVNMSMAKLSGNINRPVDARQEDFSYYVKRKG